MKTKVTINNVEENDERFCMRYMECGQICIIDDPNVKQNGHYVMRSSSNLEFGVMNLSNFGDGNCWNTQADIKVIPAPVGTKITFEVTGE